MRRATIYVVAFLAIVIGTVIFNIGGKSDIPVLPVQTVRNTSPKTVRIGGREIKVTVVDTIFSRERGLGGLDMLSPDEGMLFVFPYDGKYGFWMKDMRFSIDILWLSGRNEVVDVRKSFSPDTYPAVFTPQTPARYVLELPAGFAEEYNVKIGDIVEIQD